MHISTLTTTEPLLRDLITLTLSDQADVLVCDLSPDSVTLRHFHTFDLASKSTVDLAHSCLSCSLREAIIPALSNLAHMGVDRLVLALPPAAEALTVIPLLHEYTAPGQYLDHCVLTTCIHAVNTDTVKRDLLTHTPLRELGCHLSDDDDRCAGEVLMNGIGYADLVLSLGDDPVGGELAEHLRPFDTLMVHHLDDVTDTLLFDHRHDPDAAIARIHPASTLAWGGPHTHGVWTLDLHSDRPFHPERLAQFAADLAAHSTCARGCFWLPSRPDTVCTWEVSGGSASVGVAGSWDDSAHTHIIVTGTQDVAYLRDEITATFQRILMNDTELHHAFEWIGADDGLSHWFTPHD
ncbi:GTP-binding protein [Schaalia suimastitidis]|uniref:GTP-binding protein n=1 Tax=Schaalia suimastitidis TaxID=121163 RepID=UPI0004076766|nr:GTP-binding protein [Schaalia suimastitidis]